MKTREQYRQQIVDDCTAAGINTVGLGELLDLAANLKHEMEDLQRTVDSEGITYTTVSREGNTMVREHPAHKCLQETRQRWFAVLKELGLTAKAKKALDAIGVEEYDPDFC
jgi:sugar phosphate isomerase/epimerase